MSIKRSVRAAFFGVASLVGLASGNAFAQSFDITRPTNWQTMTTPSGTALDLQEQLKTPYQKAVETWGDAKTEVTAAKAYVEFSKDPKNPTKAKAMQDAFGARTGRMVTPSVAEEAIDEFKRNESLFMHAPDVTERYLARKETEELAARQKVIKMALAKGRQELGHEAAALNKVWAPITTTPPVSKPPASQVQWPDPMKR